ncbi:MAG TPA: right-handed parallel beta-helix repeat-containing protein [Tepidisphaeraceae bacterium]|jgi:hypothetical protein|nr:right-handed parallel beta-helix repeat-containing protein [Tepidisphaeraceae bacterium]
MNKSPRPSRPLFETLENRCLLTSYFVDATAPAGGTGTAIAPFRTIGAAATVVAAGDVVNVLAGTYYEKVSVTRSGTAAAPIVFQAVGGDVTVTNNTVAQWNALIDIRANHIKFDGIDVRDSGWYGYKVEGASNANRATNVTITNAHTLRTNASGIFVARSAQVLLLKNKVQDACISTVAGQSVHECITIGETDGFEVAENEVWNSVGHNGPANGGEGIDAKGSSKNGLIRNNTVRNLSRIGIYLDAGSKQGTGTVDENPMSNIIVTRNVVRSCSDGIAICSELGGLAHGLTITNNLIHDNRTNGITVADWADDGPRANILIAHNTVTRNGFGNSQSTWGGGIDIATTNYTDIRIINNVASHNESWQIARTRSGTVPAGQIAASGNVSFGTALSYWNPITGTPGRNADPRYVNAAANDFRLQPTSPAIDFGTATEAPTTDFLKNTRVNAPDAGAFEYRPVTLSSVVSRKVHGSAGTFDLTLAMGGANRTVEPRLNGASQLVFTFSEPVKAVDGTLSGNEFSITNATFASASVSGNTLTLNLSSVVNQRYSAITFSGLTGLWGNLFSGAATLSVGNLLGDVNGNRSVTGSDQLLVKNGLLQPVTKANFLMDLNLSGSITGADQLLVKSRLLDQLL